MSDQKIPEVEANLSDPERVRTLRAALTVVRTRETDRQDVAEDLRETERNRLELLAEKVRPLLDEVDPRDERFDLVLATGTRPRLWIDMTSFVAMGPDRDGTPKRGYRLLRDTRLGRVVVAESRDLDETADAVAAYMAERIIEREKMMEGDWLAANAQPAQTPKGGNAARKSRLRKTTAPGQCRDDVPSIGSRLSCSAYWQASERRQSRSISPSTALYRSRSAISSIVIDPSG